VGCLHHSRGARKGALAARSMASFAALFDHWAIRAALNSELQLRWSSATPHCVSKNPLRSVNVDIGRRLGELHGSCYSEVGVSWTGLELNSEQEEDVNVMLRAAWAIAYSDALASYMCAVFRAPSGKGRSRLYFSPGARELGSAFAAVPCRRPTGDGIKLVAGDQRAWFACLDGNGFEPTVQLELLTC
jgi:hypothetical protein